MGLSSVLSTAITGLQASETTIDVAGNNVANSQTIGFKSSEALFATQFLQTLSLGAAPSASSGGTNPRQIGLGVQVAAVTPDFGQGTIEISTSPSDLAIQGEGFFIVQSGSGEQVYTRAGKFQLNAQSELTTISGERLLGFGVDENFTIQTTTMTTLQIPLGSAAVAKATENVFLEGTLTPTGDVADQAEVIQSAVLSDGSQAIPADTTGIQALQAPSAPTTSLNGAPGAIEAGTYRYKVVFLDNEGNEAAPSSPSTALVVGANSRIDVASLPTAASLGLSPAEFPQKRLYRTNDSDPGAVYQLVTTLAEGTTTFTDNTTEASLDAVVPAASNDLTNEATLAAGDYGYYITFRNVGTGEESRPAALVSQTVLAGRRIRLDGIPQPNPADPGGFNQIRIYRSTGNNNSQFYHVGFLAPGQTSFIDSTPDSTITNTANPNFGTVDLNGPDISPGLRLLDVRKLENGTYTQPFQEGTLRFTPRKGERALGTKELTITSTTTVQNLLDFMESAMGIQNIVGTEGGVIASGKRLQLTGNTGVDNAIEVGLSSLVLTPTAGGSQQVNLGFGSVQEARGQSAVADFVVYDSLGIPLNVRMTAVLESRTGSETIYRWFADSPDNDPAQTDPAAQVRIAVGTGTIRFDGEGKFLGASNSTASIDRVNVPSASPLEFRFDFSQLSGLASETASLAASRQDGFAPGKLTTFLISEDGRIRGIFDNGTERSLGQIRLARFANAEGLEQRGRNLFAAGVNSGLPVLGNPGEQGIGSVIAGAVELSNTDIGENLIDLILASTQYRGNARVITAAQQLFDELLNLRR